MVILNPNDEIIKYKYVFTSVKEFGTKSANVFRVYFYYNAIYSVLQ